VAEDNTRTSKELKQDGGSKFDREKLRMDLIPVSAIEGLASVLTYGADKYADRNWEKGISWSRAFGATMRHMWSWYKGENIDPESGMPHLWHAMCNVAFLIEFSETRREFDDRVVRTYRSLAHSSDGDNRPTGPDQSKPLQQGILGRKIEQAQEATAAEIVWSIHGQPTINNKPASGFGQTTETKNPNHSDSAYDYCGDHADWGV
jgi:hypothetical protein